MIELLWPWIWLALPLPWLMRKLLTEAPQQDAALRVSDLDHYRIALETTKLNRGLSRHLLLPALIWLLLLLACSQPVWVGDPLPQPASGRDLMLAVDISSSMELEDMVWDNEQTNRLHVTREVVGDFVRRREGDRLGLIVFGTRPYLHVPLSFDRQTLASMLDEIAIGMAGPRTSIGDAIGLAVKTLRERPREARVLVLLTDGANTAGELDPLQAAQLADDHGVRIHAIGIGAEEMVTGGLLGFFQRRVNPSADLDEDTLQQIAAETGGRYFRARSSEELAAVYAMLDQLEPVEQNPDVIRPQQSLMHWPLSAALTLSVLIALGRLYEHRRSAQRIAEPAHG